MSAVNQDKVEKSIGYVLQDLGGAFLALPALIGGGFYKVLCWFRDEWQLSATIRELSRLNDHYLDDIGVKRGSLELRDEELMKRLREGRYPES